MKARLTASISASSLCVLSCGNLVTCVSCVSLVTQPRACLDGMSFHKRHRSQRAIPTGSQPSCRSVRGRSSQHEQANPLFRTLSHPATTSSLDFSGILPCPGCSSNASGSSNTDT
ncbi:hypothetical protein C0Q70_12886 [Pomacea canaliculata]|uniref:Secreted protein n=1 Tax=Pomacea canaliculata TaxID=400727 RepID=A0A2T7P2Q7_POMCA|nr:hypothetical protein C0Q70_12886 [Pomacea canaliculata]